MLTNKKILIGIIALLFILGFIWLKPTPPPPPQIQNNSQIPNLSLPTDISPSTKRTELASFNKDYQFSILLPPNWQAEYIPIINSINIYNPSASGNTTLEQSQIFIRSFSANDFLTLNTVNILSTEKSEINGHSAMRYEIQKKSGIPDFAGQPSWRNLKHKIIDIRFAQTNPSLFYVIAYNPNLDSQIFENFVQNIYFYNDAVSFVNPLDSALKRITKKPFALYVNPTNSPISPEKFSGFHTAVDLEIVTDEETQPIPVKSLCGGPLLKKQTAPGYGGLAMQRCQLNNQILTIIYGHLNFNSINANNNQYLVPGEVIGLLGEVGVQTDGERKHLHLGIKKGVIIDIRGYVPSQDELSGWIDPAQFLD